MKSDVVKVTNAGEGIDAALHAASASADYRGLAKKDAIRLRLLAEETLGMVRQITGEAAADFWIESEGERFELHLMAHPVVSGKMRRELLSASTSGKNEAAKGFMGKIRDIIDRALAAEDTGDPSKFYLQGMLLPSDPEMATPMMYSVSASMASWSMRKYLSALEEEKTGSAEAQDAWDELEKSIVVNLADEVRIAINGNEVEMTVYKNFVH